MKIYSVLCLVGLTACDQTAERNTMTFFEKYSAPELGTTKYVQPGQAAGQRGQLQKMIDVSVPDEGACPVTVSVRTEYTVNDATGNPAIGFPLVGILQWGIGGGENQLEFDIPAPRYPDNISPAGNMAASPMNNIGQGVQVFLSGASHVSLYARNDARISPLVSPGFTVIGFTEAAKVIGFLSPGGSATAPIERSIYLSTTASPLVVAASVRLTVPPFAKSIRLERTANQPLELNFFNNSGVIFRTVQIPVNSEGPVAISAQTADILVTNVGATATPWLIAVFDVTPT